MALIFYRYNYPDPDGVNAGRKILIPMCKWTDWLALDISADMAYSREMKQMQTSKWAGLTQSHFFYNYLYANIGQ